MKYGAFKVVAASLALLSAPALAAPITKTLSVDVYQVCNDAGLTVCAATGPVGNAYFTDSTNKIWAQAGIGVSFNFVSKVFNSGFYDINDGVAGDGFADLAAAYGTHGPSATNVDMFLVNTVAGAFGEGWFGAGGLVMAMQTIMNFNGGLGRIDTLAHEIGHNLGLEPASLGGDAGGHVPSNATNDSLMASGAWRNVPTTLADINPDGLGYDKLSLGEIAFVLDSTLLRDIPEPGTMALLAIALLSIAGSRRRAKARS
ncbi:MAG: PEP-CTERM sorting domain-containing protein [Acetobacteraceae bacterium]|nr:PEP-CTERM sorting domain-containing protein [Acetobacteraceae bacterium]